MSTGGIVLSLSDSCPELALEDLDAKLIAS